MCEVTMDTKSLSESIADLLKSIVHYRESGETVELDKHLSALFDIIFGRSGDGLRSLSSERILNQVDIMMAVNNVWNTYPEEKCALDDRKSLVHEIHTKLYSVLDLRIDIDNLLNQCLGSCPNIPEKLEIDFSREVKEQLGNIREENNGRLSDILSKFFQKYFDTLREEGIEVGNIKEEVYAACVEYERLEKHTDCLALFAGPNSGLVSSIRLRIDKGQGNVHPLNEITEDMKKAARISVSRGLKILGLSNEYDVSWEIDYPSTYEGPSIALPIFVALLKSWEPSNVRIDCYTGFTGVIDVQNDLICKVGRIKEKLLGAASFGLRRVFIPKDNEQEAKSLSIPDIEIIPVESLSDVRTKLITFAKLSTVTTAAPSIEAKIKAFEIKCKNKGLSVTLGKDIPYGKQLIISDYLNEIPVNIYDGQRGFKWVVGGKKTINLYGLIEQVCTEVFGPINDNTDSIKSNFWKWTIKESTRRSTIKNQLITMMDGKEMSEKNCDFRLDWLNGGQSVIVRQFTNGTLTVSGSPLSTRLFNEICRSIELAIGILPTAAQSPNTSNENKSRDLTESHDRSANITKKAIPEHATSWIGTDESGKGDYFGPLVSAGVCVNRKTELELKALGVKDSKKLSDQNVKKLAKQIRTICKGFYAEVPIPPQTYNNLYNQFKREGKNLNTLLAWGHARAIENILSNVTCEYALADQFADERFIISKLQEAGRKIKLIQMPKAEQDIAVAAASILARDLFLSYLDKMSIEYHLKFPKGASAEVIRIAKEVTAKHGKDALSKVAKLHFKTTQEVLK